MKAKIDASGNLFVNKGNGYLPQICISGTYTQCCMLCPHFGEPKVVGGLLGLTNKFVRITICGSDKLEFASIYFEKTCTRMAGYPCEGTEPDDLEIHSMRYWVNMVKQLKEEIEELKDKEARGIGWNYGEIADIEQKIARIKYYHFPD